MNGNRTFIQLLTLYVALHAIPAAAAAIIDRDVVGCGGGTTSGSNHTVVGTVGQPLVGRVADSFHVHEIGFWSQSLEVPTGISEVEAAAPTLCSMVLAGPNPFGSATALKLSVAEAAPIKVVLYDVGGRAIRVLHDGVAEAGIHELALSPRGLASGVYLCRMEVGAFSETIKLMLMK